MIAHQDETTLLYKKAARMAVTDTIKNVDMLETYAKSFKFQYRQMEANQTPTPPALGLELAKRCWSH